MKRGSKGQFAEPRYFQRNPLVIFGEPLAKGFFGAGLGGCGMGTVMRVVVGCGVSGVHLVVGVVVSGHCVGILSSTSVSIRLTIANGVALLTASVPMS